MSVLSPFVRVEPHGLTAVAPIQTLRRAEPSVALANEGTSMTQIHAIEQLRRADCGLQRTEPRR